MQGTIALTPTVGSHMVQNTHLPPTLSNMDCPLVNLPEVVSLYAKYPVFYG